MNPQSIIAFLLKLRAAGPWVLTAIEPDGPTITTTVKTVEAALDFIKQYDCKKNLYYSVNPTRGPIDKKAKKTDIGAIEYLLADLDPAKDESPEDAKARYRGELKTYKPKATAIIDSGNGIQVLWRLKVPIFLPKGEDNAALIAEVEARSGAAMKALGCEDLSTRNIDRILRIPGTTNVPNAKKRKAGRIAVETSLIEFNDRAYDLDDFPSPEEKPEEDEAKPTAEKRSEATLDELEEIILEGGGERWGKDRSDAVWFVVNGMLRRGYRGAAITKTLLERKNKISEHIYDQPDPREYAERQVSNAIGKIGFTRKKDDEPPIPNRLDNIAIALLKMGVTIRYDRFADRILLDGLPGFGPVLEDAAVNRIWLTFDQRFRFRPPQDLTHIVLGDIARLNEFHPVADYLNGLEWDGTPRLDAWLISYAGAEDSKYVRAVGSITLIAAVRRIRKPGCKFDEMLVLEQPEQGTEKSTALAVLAVHVDWFGDDMPLNVESKRVIEMIRGRWIIEAAELSGMRKTDAEHLKAMLSRRIDRARMAWGRLPIEAPRQCIIIGTTNKIEYLRDTTGNRRFWPVRIQAFNIEELKRDRDQLWAEAAAREAKGESIRLPQKLWPDAATEQKARLAEDPYAAVLAKHLGGMEGKIRSADVWTILDLKGAQLTQEAFQRSAEAMRTIGWKRPNKGGVAKFHGQTLSAFVRGDKSKTVIAIRDKGELTVCYEGENYPNEPEF